MAWIPGTDTKTATVVGNGTPISQFEVKQYVNSTDTTLTIFNPENASSNFLRLVGISEFTANQSADEIKYYDGFDELGAKRGRKSTEFSLTQENRGDLETIKQFENQYCWYAEAIGDDRDLTNTDGTNKYQIIKMYYGKLVTFTEDKGDLYTISGSGSFDTSKMKTIYRGITPAGSVTLTPSGGATASTGVAKTFTVTTKDLYNADITITDLSAVDLSGEITSIEISKVTGTPTVSVASGSSDDQKLVTFTGTGTVTVKATINTKSAGKFESSNLEITVS